MTVLTKNSCHKNMKISEHNVYLCKPDHIERQICRNNNRYSVKKAMVDMSLLEKLQQFPFDKMLIYLKKARAMMILVRSPEVSVKEASDLVFFMTRYAQASY